MDENLEPIILPPVDTAVALKLGEDIELLLGQISSHELRLSHSYARLGNLLLRAKNEALWIPLGYQRFSTMIEDIGKKIDRRRSQMYAILSVAETLSPYLSEEQLETIGIAKSHELRRFVKQSMQRPDVPLLDGPLPETTLAEFALSSRTTAAQLHVEVSKLLHEKESPTGYWFEYGGGYLLADERKEIEQWWDLGKLVLGIGDEVSEHEWKKQVMLASARECLSQWLPELAEAGNAY